MRIAPLLLSAFALSTARAEPAAVPATPLGVWEVANSHELPVRAELAFAAGGVLVVSDRETRVIGFRPDSGLTVWSRELTAKDASIHHLETSATAEGAIVVIADTALRGFRADVGTRLWEVPMRCEGALCAERIVYAGPVTYLAARQPEDPAKSRPRPDLKADVLLLARGGQVQSEVIRLDPRTGRPMWNAAAPVLHPRRALVAQNFIAVEEAISPFGITFLDPNDGKVLGRFERKLANVSRPLGELAVAGDLLIAVDLRPADGALASIVVLDTTGRIVTERQMSRPAPLGGVEHLPVEGQAIAAGFAVLTPVPAQKKAVASILRLENPWTVRTEVFTDTRNAGVGPLGSGLIRFGGDAVWFTTRGPERQVVVQVIHSTRAEARLDGFLQEPAVVYPLGASLLVVGPPSKEGASLATIDRRGAVAFGAPELAYPVVVATMVDQDLVLVTRAPNKPDRIERLSLVDWAVALDRLRAAHKRGADITALVTRLGRFYPLQDALGDAVAVPRQGELSSADKSLLAALRDAWRSGDAKGALDGLRELIEREPERSERRLSLIQATAELTLDMVLGAGGNVKLDVAERLVGLARIAESETQRCAKADCEVKSTSIALLAAAMGLVDEPLAGADLLARAPATTLSTNARLELARRALHLLRKSAGNLRTDTSRQMLVSGLRFFLHFDQVMGESAAEASTLLDQASHDTSNAQKLDALLNTAEGPAAKKKALGPALCQLACEAAQSICGETRARLTACQDRCTKTGAVRFSTAARPTADPQWYCR